MAQLSEKLRKEVTVRIDVREYSRPETREELMKRVKSNLGNFRMLYGTTGNLLLIKFLLHPTLFAIKFECFLFIVMVFFVYFMLTSPLLLWRTHSE